uniref:Uncharacterized protein n=1 Tax=Panagrellus redivivus TaxID=6233 RepID=A0A7E4V383_PANRE
MENGILSLVELNALIAKFPFHDLDQAKKPSPLPIDLFLRRQTQGPKRRRVTETTNVVEPQDNGKHISQKFARMARIFERSKNVGSCDESQNFENPNLSSVYLQS